jgi:hypothetical protein
MGSIHTFVSAEQLNVLEILAHKRPALWEVIEPHGLP